MMHVVNIQTVTKSENDLSSMNAILAENNRMDRIERSGIPASSFGNVRLDSSSDLPYYCKRKGAMCQAVDSRLRTNNIKR